MAILLANKPPRAGEHGPGLNTHLGSRRALSTIVSVRTWSTLERITTESHGYYNPGSLRIIKVSFGSLPHNKCIISAWIELIMGSTNFIYFYLFETQSSCLLMNSVLVGDTESCCIASRGTPQQDAGLKPEARTWMQALQHGMLASHARS